MSPNLPEKITAQEVPESERLNCLPRHFGRRMMHVENLIYDFMREMSPDYNGAYWRFFDLSNGGFYMAPDLNVERVRVQIENGYDGLMTADAAGITARLFALSHFSFAVKDDTVADHFHCCGSTRWTIRRHRKYSRLSIEQRCTCAGQVLRTWPAHGGEEGADYVAGFRTMGVRVVRVMVVVVGRGATYVVFL